VCEQKIGADPVQSVACDDLFDGAHETASALGVRRGNVRFEQKQPVQAARGDDGSFAVFQAEGGRVAELLKDCESRGREPGRIGEHERGKAAEQDLAFDRCCDLRRVESVERLELRDPGGKGSHRGGDVVRQKPVVHARDAGNGRDLVGDPVDFGGRGGEALFLFRREQHGGLVEQAGVQEYGADLFRTAAGGKHARDVGAEGSREEGKRGEAEREKRQERRGNRAP